MKLLKIIVFFIPLLASTGLVIAQNAPVYHKSTEVNQVVLAALTYTSVAGVCRQRDAYFDLKSALVHLLERENSSRNLTREGAVLYSNLETYIAAGEKGYENNPYVTCGDAIKYIEMILDLVNSNLRK